MDTLSDFQKYTSVHPAVQKFRPWTELFIEIALAGLFTIGFVAWSQTIIEAGGLVCVPAKGDTVGYSLSESRYINSRCQVTFGPRMLIFYPYYIIINFGVLLITHILWSKIPSVVAKLSTFCSLFNQISKLSPTFYKNSPNNRILPSFDHQYHEKDNVKMLHERIIFMFLERSYVMKIYFKKCRFLSIICFLSIFMTTMWIWLSNFGNTTYSCTVNYVNNTRPSEIYSCDASPLVYIFGVMIFHLFVLIIIFGLSIYATFFSISFKKNLDVFSSDENYDRFKGLPGIQDFVFCVSLLRSNFPDGLYTFHAVKYILTQCQNLDTDNNTKIVSDVKISLFTDDPEVIKKKERYLSRLHKFDEGVLVVRFMVYELGLREIPNKQNRNHLYDCLSYIIKKCDTFNTEIYNQSIREIIVKELVDNRSYYKLVLDMIDLLHSSSSDSESKDTTKYPFYKLECAIERIRNSDVWGDWISIAAICNIVRCKILLIHAGKTHGKMSKSIIDDFSPHNSNGNGHVFFMTYLEPHYYHVTESMVELSSTALENREKYINQPTERKLLRKLAIRYVTKSQNVIVEAIKKPEQSEILNIHKNRRLDPNNTLTQRTLQGHFGINQFADYPRSSSSSVSSDIFTFNHPNEPIRTVGTGLFNDNDKAITSAYMLPKSFSKIKHHIQLTMGKRDPFIDFKKLSYDNKSSESSEN